VLCTVIADQMNVCEFMPGLGAFSRRCTVSPEITESTLKQDSRAVYIISVYHQATENKVHVWTEHVRQHEGLQREPIGDRGG